MRELTWPFVRKGLGMKFKYENDTDKIRQDVESHDDEKMHYQAWGKLSGGSSWEKLLKRVEVPVVIIGIGIVVLMVVIVALISQTKKPAFNAHLVFNEKRLAHIEDRLNDLEGRIEGLRQTPDQTQNIRQFENKLQKVESALGLRVDKLSAEVAQIQQLTAGIKSAVPATEIPQKKTLPETQKRLHQVRAGETLYSISRQYGLTVNDLLRLNGLSSNAVIHPGQEIVVGP